MVIILWFLFLRPNVTDDNQWMTLKAPIYIGVLMLISMIVLAILISKSETFKKDEKQLWIILVVSFPIVGIPYTTYRLFIKSKAEN